VDLAGLSAPFVVHNIHAGKQKATLVDFSAAWLLMVRVAAKDVAMASCCNEPSSLERSKVVDQSIHR